MDELPELPFEQVLSYLNLEDRLKSRAVSRAWYHKINSFKANSLCYSERPSDFLFKKIRWVTSKFAQNFISSTRFDLFFTTFSQSLLSNLRHLRLWHLHIDEESRTTFSRTLNSLNQLEELDLISFIIGSSYPVPELELNLPMLNSIQIEKVYGIYHLTLDASRLRKVELVWCDHLRLAIVHGESVEHLLTSWMAYTEVKNLKNLQTLYIGYTNFDPTLLSGLDHLKEIYLNNPYNVESLFEQKRKYGLVDLKIYICGLLLNGPHPVIRYLSPHFNEETLVQLAENRFRLADEMPFNNHVYYSIIERFDPEVAIDLVSRFIHLEEITVDRTVQDIERFLDLLNNFNEIARLNFKGDQPQDLFDRLPENCAVQQLVIENAPLGFEFLTRLKHLNELYFCCSIETDFILKLFEGLPFLTELGYRHLNKSVGIALVKNSGWIPPKKFKVTVDSSYQRKWTDVPDLDAAIQFITGDSQPNTDLIRRSARIAALNRSKPY